MIEGEIRVGDVFRYPSAAEGHRCAYSRVTVVPVPGTDSGVRAQNGPTAEGPWDDGDAFEASPAGFRASHERIPNRVYAPPALAPYDTLPVAPAPAPVEPVRLVPPSAPAASQHPADLKPRGVKDPLHLIPWGAMPYTDNVPAALHEAAERAGHWPDGDPFRALHDEPEWLSWLACRLIEEIGIAAVARVFAYGARKYARDNWRTFTWDQAAEDAYFGAIFRHLVSDHGGEKIDPESGEPHKAHAACGALIVIWHYRYGKAGE